MRAGSYTLQTPVGRLFIEAEEGIPKRIILPGFTRETKGSIQTPSQAVLDIADALKAYFGGIEPERNLLISLVKGISISSFAEKVIREVIDIPWGSTLAYREVAIRAGKPLAARGVGNIMHANPFPILIPCHRVIKSDGSPGGYGGGENIKVWLLGFEGASLKLG